MSLIKHVRRTALIHPNNRASDGDLGSAPCLGSIATIALLVTELGVVLRR